MSLLLMLGLALAGGLALARCRRRWGAALLSVAALLLAGVAWGVLPPVSYTHLTLPTKA